MDVLLRFLEQTPVPALDPLVSYINTAVQAVFLALFVIGWIVPQKLAAAQLQAQVEASSKTLAQEQARSERLAVKNDELQRELYKALEVTRQQSETLAQIASRMEVSQDGHTQPRSPATHNRTNNNPNRDAQAGG